MVATAFPLASTLGATVVDVRIMSFLVSLMHDVEG